MIALVLGCAENVWDDAIAVLSRCSPDAIFAVKDMMARWPARIDYACTLHPDRTDQYLRERTRKKYPNGFNVWAHRNFGSKTHHKITRDWAGSSGLFAVKLAMEQGFSGIVLAGIPMESGFGHVTRRQPWGTATQFRNGWIHHKEELKVCVRSMSGWTREMFGTPTDEWLAQHGSTEPCRQILQILSTRHDVAVSDGERQHG